MTVRQAHGFTLLEILIALAVFAVLAVMAYGGLRAILQAQAGTDPRAKQLGQLQSAIYQLNEDLNQAVNRNVRDELGGPEPAFSQGRGSELLVFTRSVPSWGQQTAANELQRVSYRFENGALYRQVWTILDRTPQTLFRRRKLLEVEQVQVNVYDPKAHLWQPFQGKLEKLPAAVQLEFQLAGLGAVKHAFLLNP